MLEPYYYLMFWFNQNLKKLFLALVIFFRVRAGKNLNFQRNDDVNTNITWPLWFFLYFLRAFVFVYQLAKFHWFSIKSIGVRGVGHFCPPTLWPGHSDPTLNRVKIHKIIYQHFLPNFICCFAIFISMYIKRYFVPIPNLS